MAPPRSSLLRTKSPAARGRPKKAPSESQLPGPQQQLESASRLYSHQISVLKVLQQHPQMSQHSTLAAHKRCLLVASMQLVAEAPLQATHALNLAALRHPHQ
eukprot:2693343-Pleurochrysis_carterae.AAC.1